MTSAWQPATDPAGKAPHPRLAELAELVGASLRPRRSADRRVVGIRPLADADADELSFVHSAAYFGSAAASTAAALVVAEDLARELGEALAEAEAERPLLVVAESRPAVARLLGVFYVDPPSPPGIHPTAVVGAGTEVGDDVHVGPYAVIGEGCRIGEGAVVEAHVVIGRRCEIGGGSRLHAGAVIYDGCVLGRRVRVHSNTVIGSHGFGFVTADGVHRRVPQVGRVEIGDDVEVGALSAVDRAQSGATRVGSGSKIDNFVMVAHNAVLGEGCILCGQAALAGSAELGDHVVLGAGAGVGDHVRVGKGARMAARASGYQEVAEDETMGGGFPGMELGLWRRVSRALFRLPEMLRRLRRMEKRLDRFDSLATDATSQDPKSPSGESAGSDRSGGKTT